METQKQTITLNADLYDNPLTGRPGDYCAKVRATGTLHNADIAERIVAERSEYRKETILHILNLADQKKMEAIASGKSVVDGIGQYQLSVQGVFYGAKAQFNPEKHNLSVICTIGTRLRKMLNQIKLEIGGLARTGPVVNTVTDITLQSVNGRITSSAPLLLNGSGLKIQGENEANGVYLTSQESGAPLKIAVIHNTPSQLILQLPPLPDGIYTLSVTTQYCVGTRNVKEPRTYTFPIPLTVGGEESTL